MDWPLEQQGSSGENVRTIQFLLNASGATVAVDGLLGPETVSAVLSFQNANGLSAEGIVGNETWPALVVNVSLGSAGDAVRAVQSQIGSRSGWLTISGIFDTDTDNAVRWFQRNIGLPGDGIVGPQTWNAFVSDYLEAENGKAASDALFTAWQNGDQLAASKNATPQAVSAMFSRTWNAGDGWGFAECGAAAGHFLCTWTRPGGQVVLQGNDNTGAPFYFVESVTFQP